MKKLLFSLILAALFLTACAPKPPTSTPVPTLQVSDAGKTIEVSAGNEFKIIVDSNPSTGYHWELIGNLDDRVVQFVSKDYRGREPVMPGSGGVDVWTFKALAAGETKIVLGNYPPAQGEPAAQEVTFTIVVK